MNYLAHAFLSGQDEEILVGNFIADSVKGSQLQLFPPKIEQGIILHRQIDVYTDTHPVVRQSKERLRPKYRKYAGVITDVFYDHYLAANFNQYSKQTLGVYAQQVYAVVKKYQAILPERVHYFLPYMIQQNWLLHYAELGGIQKSLTGLSRRTSFVSDMENAVQDLEAYYPVFAAEFFAFFPDLQDYVQHQLHQLNK